MDASNRVYFDAGKFGEFVSRVSVLPDLSFYLVFYNSFDIHCPDRDNQWTVLLSYIFAIMIMQLM